MIAFAYYLLKVLICSAILFLYYKMALQGKAFHQWNRFYLLIITILSLVLPCLQIPWLQSKDAPKGPIKILQVVTSADEYVAEISGKGSFKFSPEQWGWLLYAITCAVLAVGFIFSMIKIRKLIHNHSVHLIEQIKFIETSEPGTPFSFFRYIFWNTEIELQSETGQQILQHEMVHVQENHSLDKVFMQIILLFFWCNPVFWLIRRELSMIHEFIADKKAVGASGAPALAAVILQSAYPGKFQNIINPFFQTSIKRRLAMLTKKQSPRFRYATRILALPVLAAIGLAFTVKIQNATTQPTVHVDEPITVVIDAGHGYMKNNLPTGGKGNGIIEDNLVLEIAQKIKEENSNQNIRLLFTREDKNNIDIHDRLTFANEHKADLVISLHANVTPPQYQNKNTTGGFEVYISKKNQATQQGSILLGSSIIGQLTTLYKTVPNLAQREVGIYILDKTTCPAVIVECGDITNKNDLDFIRKESNQRAVANAILNAIANFAAQKDNVQELSTAQLQDTLPKKVAKEKCDTLYKSSRGFLIQCGVADVNKILYVLNGQIKGTYKDFVRENMDKNLIESVGVEGSDAAIKKYGEKGKYGLFQVITKEYAKSLNNTSKVTITENNQVSDNVLIVVNGEVKGTQKNFKLNSIPSNQIRSISVLEDKAAVDIYGKKGINGVIEITTKDNVNVNQVTAQKNANDTAPAKKKVFEKVHIEAKFPGGQEAWAKYLVKNLNPNIPVDKGAGPGAYTVVCQFIVHEDGSISDLKPLTKHGYGMEEEVMRLLKSVPQWIPAVQNGRNVSAYKKQPVTFVVAEE